MTHTDPQSEIQKVSSLIQGTKDIAQSLFNIAKQFPGR